MCIRGQTLIKNIGCICLYFNNKLYKHLYYQIKMLQTMSVVKKIMKQLTVSHVTGRVSSYLKKEINSQRYPLVNHVLGSRKE